MAAQCRYGLALTGQARRGVFRSGKAGQARQGAARRGKAGRGKAGEAWHGPANPCFGAIHKRGT